MLNMKPPEVTLYSILSYFLVLMYLIYGHQILSMIEEAAGTRMYESKKLSAQKTIVKKETKLKEIETVRNLF